MGKSTKLPFSAATTQCVAPFDKISCDLWGLSPETSIHKYRYYVAFVDNYFHFVWFYLLVRKSDFFKCYLAFEKMILRQFSARIKVFHSDSGGEFVSEELKKHFVHEDIIHQFSCPCTPQQTDMVERRQRTIAEMRITQLIHSHVPLRFWIESFTFAVFLMNRLPSFSLPDKKSPFEWLFKSKSDYTCFRVFGCSCFPYLKAHASHKLSVRSRPCVFLG